MATDPEKERLLKEFGIDYGYPSAPKSIDDLRADEFKRLKEVVYLDHAGATLYSELQMEAVFKDFNSTLYGNPYSQKNCSLMTSDIIGEAPRRVLNFFNASTGEYKCVFTSEATEALKLVGETFPWSNQSTFMYTMENHNSVLGIREYALREGAAAIAVDIEANSYIIKDVVLFGYLTGIGALILRNGQVNHGLGIGCGEIGIFIKYSATGCFCNPGACAKHLCLSHSDLLSNVEAGHVCWDDYDVLNGKPTGAVRMSFGYMSTFEDAQNFLYFIESIFMSLPAQSTYMDLMRERPSHPPSEELQNSSHGQLVEVSPSRFRPNLVVSGGEPYAEDSWRSIKSLGGCNGCQMINMTAKGGTVHRSNEPLATIASYRRLKGKIYFGILLHCMTISNKTMVLRGTRNICQHRLEDESLLEGLKEHSFL